MFQAYIMKLSLRVLSLLSLAFGLVATGALSLAVATDYWLFTEESMTPGEGDVDPLDISFNDSAVLGPDIENISLEPYLDSSPVRVAVHSGLWRMCIQYESLGLAEDYSYDSQCFVIVYTGWARVSGTDVTWAILRAIRKAAPIITFSLLLELIALGISTWGNAKNNSKTLVGAICFIFAALFLATGVIMYISGVNDEVAHQKNPSNPEERFQYQYGWAFFFAGGSFVLSMAAAVANITLYLRRYTSLEDMIRVIPGLGKKSGNINFSRIPNNAKKPQEEEEPLDLYAPSLPIGIRPHNPTIIL